MVERSSVGPQGPFENVQLTGLNQWVQDLITEFDRGRTAYGIVDLPTSLQDTPLATWYLQKLQAKREERRER